MNVKFETLYERKFGLLKIKDHGLDLPEESYILYSPALEKILFDRSLVGWELQVAVYRVARAFFEALRDNIMQEYPPGTRFEQVNLAGSDYYQLQSAHAKVYNSSLPRNYIALRRELEDGSFDECGKQKFRTEISYKRFEAKGKLCILGETIATGVSACDSLEIHLPYAIGYGLEALVVFSIAGSKVGSERIYQTIKKVEKEYNKNLKVIFVFGMGLFGLGKDGTALTWWNEDNIDKTITLPEFENKAKEIFQPGECCIGDWGQRFADPDGYLGEWKKELEKKVISKKSKTPSGFLIN